MAEQRVTQIGVDIATVSAPTNARVTQVGVDLVVRQAGVTQAVKGKTKGSTPLRVPSAGSAAMRANTYAVLAASGDREGTAELFNSAGVSQGSMTADVSAVNTDHVNAYIFRKQITTGGDFYAVFTMPGGGASAGVLMEVDGLNLSDPLDKTASATGNSNAPSSGATAATAQAYEIAVGVIGTEGPESDSAGSWSNDFQAGVRIGSSGQSAVSNSTVSEAYKVLSSTGAQTAAKTGVTSRRWAAVIATYKGFQATAPVVVDPLSVTTTSLADGEADIAYAEFLEATGGTLPYTFTVTAGALPDGLSLSSDGAITGTPTEPGTYSFTVTATDSAGSPLTDTQDLSIEITGDTAPVRLSPGAQGSPLASSAADRISDGVQGSPFVRGTYSSSARRTSGTPGSPVTRNTE